MFEGLKRLFTKDSRIRAALLATYLGQPVWTPVDYANLAKQGYMENVYVYACVRQIAWAAAGIPWLAFREATGGPKELEPGHALSRLIKRPNPGQGGSRFTMEYVSYLLLTGDSYIERVGPGQDGAGQPRELYALRPDRVKVVPGNPTNPIARYDYTVNGKPLPLKPEVVLHLSLFNPLDDWYGLGPTRPAARSIDQNNESRAWNVALLQNSARPPGAVRTDQNLPEEQYQRLKKEIREQYSGSKNAGRPMLLEGGLDWKEMSLSPEEMHWAEGIKISAREIAIAYGVAPELIGDTANKTYSNYREARQALYTETVLPLMDYLRDEWNNWLAPLFGDGLFLDYDRDEIEALQEDRAAVWDRALKAVERAVLTPNEARQLLGYDPLPGGDTLLAPGSLMPLAAIVGEGATEEAV